MSSDSASPSTSNSYPMYFLNLVYFSNTIYISQRHSYSVALQWCLKFVTDMTTQCTSHSFPNETPFIFLPMHKAPPIPCLEIETSVETHVYTFQNSKN